MNTINLSCYVNHDGEAVTFEFSPYNDGETTDDLIEAANVVLREAGYLGNNVSVELDDIEIADWDNVKEEYQDINKIFLLAEAFALNPDFEEDIIYAALECEIQPENIEEAYSGQYASAEEFAEEIAKQLDLIQKSSQWPYTCIDWKEAAHELMYDYCESNGYYFRNL